MIHTMCPRCPEPVQLRYMLNKDALGCPACGLEVPGLWLYLANVPNGWLNPMKLIKYLEEPRRDCDAQ